MSLIVLWYSEAYYLNKMVNSAK